MSGRSFALAVALLAGCAPARAQELPEGTPLPEFFAQCEDKDGWSDPAPPIRLYANVYGVGTCGIVSLLVIGDAGSVLIDGGPADAAPLIAANIERLGVRLTDVKVILTSHEHHDHVGGVAELQRLTGARVVARAEAKPSLETGTLDPADPQAGLHDPFPAVGNVRVIGDGHKLRIGSLEFTMHATPGHAPGSTSWTWRSCGTESCPLVAYVDSVTAVSTDSYRFTDHPEYVTAFRRSLDKIEAMECDFVITPHPSASQLYERLAGDAPLFSDQACGNYARWGREQFEERLAREAAGG